MYPKQTRLLNYLEPRISYNKGQILSLSKWKKEILTRDKNKCKSCLNEINDIFRNRNFQNEAHHIIPRHHGGKNTLGNGVTLCRFCHNYFDLMYFRYGLDYHDIKIQNTNEQIINEVKRLMHRRYHAYLLNAAYPLVEG